MTKGEGIEAFPDYTEFLGSPIWPSVGVRGDVKTTYIDTMAPQHCSAAIYKLKRWNEQQWSRDIDVERHWQQLEETLMVRYLQARAAGKDDFSEIHTANSRANSKGAAHVIARMMLEGAGDEEDPMYVATLATRAAKNLYARGYVIVFDGM